MRKQMEEGCCERCRRRLKSPLSLARGFGAVCWGKRHPQLEFWPELLKKEKAHE